MNKIAYYIEKRLNYGHNFDVIKREINNNTIMFYLSSLADVNLVNQIIEGKIFKRDAILNASIVLEEDYEKILVSIYSGCLLLIENNQCYIIETRNYPNRSVNESESEKSLKGSHDGFTESILTNTALIRRRIKDDHFRCELFQVGKISKTDITINYLDGMVNQSLLLKIKRKLKTIDVNSIVLADKAIAELVFEQKYQIFPKVRFSERPDIASIHILKGYIVILVDTSSSCIIVPTTFFELNEQLEEYQLPSLISTFNRIFRLFCVVIGLFLLPIWFIICIEGMPPNNSFLIIEGLTKNELFVQIIAVQIFLSTIRLASYNTTSLLSTSMSLLATIILSNLAVETGLLSSEVVFYGALSSICCYAISNYETSRAITFWNLIMIFSVGFFYKIGFIISSTIMFITVVTIHSFDICYLYPFIPFNLKDLINRIFKLPPLTFHEKPKIFKSKKNNSRKYP